MKNVLVRSTLTALARLGVAEVCVAAGARNAPLVAALLASEGVKIWNFFEERCAAFFALGRIMADRAPVAVLTTSGTAAAELLPAVIEAYYQGLPLVVVTADRPKRYRGTGAPQSIEQKNLFSPYVGVSLDVEQGESIAWPARAGDKPIHINLCLEEPLATNVAGIDFLKHQAPAPLPSKPILDFHPSEELETLVTASGLQPRDAAEIAPRLVALGCPILAEATSNLWGCTSDFPELASLLFPSTEVIYQAFQPKQIVRIGGVPSPRWWRDLEDLPQVPVINLSRLAFPGLARRDRVACLPWAAQVFLSEWRLKPATCVHSAVADFASILESFPLSEPAWLQKVASRFSDGERVFVGNSLPVRELNMSRLGLGRKVAYFANRGANGIDGLVSTWLGTCASARSSWLILGDLSAMYDLAAPWILPQLPRGDRKLVVVNNHGGKIFARVPSLNGLPNEARHVIENRHRMNFQPWAQLWGMDYCRVQRATDLDHLPEGPVLIELLPVEEQTEAFYAAVACQSKGG